jgi:hypothetical protein
LVAHARVGVGHRVERVVLVGRPLLAKSGAAESEDPVAEMKSLKGQGFFVTMTNIDILDMYLIDLKRITRYNLGIVRVGHFWKGYGSKASKS